MYTSLVIDFPADAREAAGEQNYYEIDVFIDRRALDDAERREAVERHGLVGHATRRYWLDRREGDASNRMLTQAEAEDLALSMLRKVEGWDVLQFGRALPLRARVRPRVDVRDGRLAGWYGHRPPTPGTWGDVMARNVLAAAA